MIKNLYIEVNVYDTKDNSIKDTEHCFIKNRYTKHCIHSKVALMLACLDVPETSSTRFRTQVIFESCNSNLTNRLFVTAVEMIGFDALVCQSSILANIRTFIKSS